MLWLKKSWTNDSGFLKIGHGQREKQGKLKNRMIEMRAYAHGLPRLLDAMLLLGTGLNVSENGRIARRRSLLTNMMPALSLVIFARQLDDLAVGVALPNGAYQILPP